jgi:4-hydroxy-3-polyprenylbenzoate decarboxylase
MESSTLTELPDRIVVGMTGNEGLSYGLTLLRLLDPTPIEVHLVLSPRARSSFGQALDGPRRLVHQVHPHDNQAARISSGSFLTRGMIVVPCSSHSAAAIGLGLARNLVQRAADVTLKEQRPLVLAVPRAAFDTLDRELVARLSSVPQLRLTPLEGPEDEAAVRLLAQLGVDVRARRA